MFGSNFDANFGIPAFPLEGIDQQGGMFGQNTPQPPGTPDATTAGSAQSQPPPLGSPVTAPTGPGPALGAPSPLGGGVLSPRTPLTQPTTNPGAMGQAPAAGQGSPFGAPNV